MRLARLSWLPLIAALTFAPAASAADPVAETLFQDAIALMKESKFAEACPKLEASQAREAKSGTLLVLGSCHEQLGRTATAWAEYKEAATLARTEGRNENAERADEFAAAVEPKLSRLTIVVSQPPEGAALTIALDGEPVAAGILGSAVPLDPGTHTIDASASGFEPHRQTVTIGPDGDAQTVTIPALTPLVLVPSPAPEPAVQPVMPAPMPPLPQTPPDEGDDEATPVWVWVVGGAGLAMLAASIAFRVDQSAAGGALDDNCGADRTACPASYDFMSDRAREERSFGLFVGFGAGGIVALGVAAIGLF